MGTGFLVHNFLFTSRCKTRKNALSEAQNNATVAAIKSSCFLYVLVAKWLTLRFAKPTCAGSTPAQDSLGVPSTKHLPRWWNR